VTVDNPLIVQSDRTLLLEVAHPRAEECRAQLARFAELERSPEHIHTYRISPLSLWNAAAAGMSPAEMVAALNEFSKYPVPAAIGSEIVDQASRYGRLVIESDGGSLILRADEPAVLEEVSRAKAVAALLGARLGPDRFAFMPLARGRLKQALIKAGWPARDLAGYTDGVALELGLVSETADGEPFVLRPYQHAAARAFWMAGGAEGGSGVLVLPCGAGKTVIGMDVMAQACTSTLILATNVVAVRQWKAEVLRRTTLREDQVGEYSGQEKSVRPVTIATYQVLTHRSKGADKEDPNSYPHLALLSGADWGLVIYDEVHLLPAPVFRMTAEIQSKRRLGLTATLIREDGREDDVFSLIGPKRYDAPWRELEGQGWIAPAVCEEVRVAFDQERRMEYAVAELADRHRIAATNPRKLAVLEAIARHHADDRVLVIGQYIDQLEEVAAHLGSPLLTGKTANREREKLYEAFRTGELRRLVVSKVANFSIDLPEANVAIQISGTFGSRQEEAQRLGRILRPKADGGQASFYTIVTRESSDQDFALHRQMFLAEQGYRYEISDESRWVADLPPSGRPVLRVLSSE
jgi:DNA excision repair protein ERCC-3